MANLRKIREEKQNSSSEELIDTYYDDSFSYDEADAYVNAPSKMFIEETAKEIEIEVDGKQNAIQLQPSTPPANPQLGDMWIDNNTFPNIIYAWDGQTWNKVSATTAEDVGSYTTAQVDSQFNAVITDQNAIADRTTVIEEQVNDGESLASKITNTTTYRNDITDQIAENITTEIENLNIGQYVTASELEQSINAVIAKFKTGGGVNLLRNSVGYGDLTNWQVMSGTADTIIGDEMASGSGFVLKTGVISQVFPALAGEPYTITLKVKKGTIGSAYLKVSDGTNFQQIDFIASAAYDYVQVQVSGFIPANNVVIVELGASGATGGAIFTDIMANTGTEGFQWSHANGELYNATTQADINGLRVQSSVYDGYTVMSPQEFSGYARNGQGIMEKVFTLNKDTTEMTKAQIDEELAIGTMKIRYVNGGGNKGWAIIGG